MARSKSQRDQRRQGRHAVDLWSGRYRLEDASGWRECRLVDVSETGAGFDAFMLPTDAASVSTAELEIVDPYGDADTPIIVKGNVRHLTRSPDGQVRVGLEFVGLTDLEGRLLGLLFRTLDSSRPRRLKLARA